MAEDADDLTSLTSDWHKWRRDEQSLAEDADKVISAAAVEEKHVVVDLTLLQPLLLALARHAEQRFHLAI